jgi:RNA polymerase-binding transcription factor
MSKHLTLEQSIELHQKLLSLKKEIEDIINVSNESAKPVNLDEPIGRISRMDAIQVQSIAKATRENLILKSKQVDASLEDYRNDRYGICRMCSNTIAYTRLSARPESPFCLDCQSAIEKRAKR